MKYLILAMVLVFSACGQGPQGVQGPAGTVGQEGSIGPQGKAGTVVQGIQVCPGLVGDYPDTFPESVLCIGGQAYGVYSANGGFLALLPPGTYTSNGINASCTFTIGADCAINP